MSNNNALPIAQLAIYGFLSLPTLYILFRHKKDGLLGWLYLLAFCVLRLTGNGLFISDPSSSGGTVITNIGLSPLLLATLGILHEARTLRNPHLLPHIEIPTVAAIHFLVAGGLALVAVGSSALTSASPKADSLALVKAGIIVLLVSWLLISAGAIVSLRFGMDRERRDQRNGEGSTLYNDGTLLLNAILLSSPLLGLRLIYAVVSFFVRSATLNPVTGSLALRVCLSVVPEIVIVVLFVVAGLATRKAEKKGSSSDERELMRRHGHSTNVQRRSTGSRERRM